MDDNTQPHVHQPSISEILRINVSGKIYELPTVLISRLERFAQGNHDERVKLCDGYSKSTSTFFFQRSPEIFEKVVDFYRSKELHASYGVCSEEFKKAINFWGIDTSFVSSCCLKRLGLKRKKPRPKNKDDYSTTDEMGSSIGPPNGANLVNCNHVHKFDFENSATEKDAFDKVIWGHARRKLWDVVDNPASSPAAKIFGALSTVFVSISVLCMIIGSIEAMQVGNGILGDPESNFVLDVIEYTCIVWFTIEFVLRLLITAEKCSFFRAPINLIDLASVVPSYVELTFFLAGYQSQKMQNVKGVFQAMRLLRILRVVRVLKLARHSSGMMSFGNSLRASANEIGMLFTFISITVLIFSTTVYFFEKDATETRFTSIPATFWWCIVTMTTVGYGDMIPTTLLGKMVASLTTISGVIVLAFPITMIVENFNKEYQQKEKAKVILMENKRLTINEC